jgi:hypothetical protein
MKNEDAEKRWDDAMNKIDWYNRGAADVYYSKTAMYPKTLTKEQKAAYWKGYNDEPYGRKDYGYDEE